jgi:citrate lyase subunit beta / citryl-CoA lyase
MSASAPKPLRSVLFVAGSDPAELAAAPNHGAEAVVIDIEEPRTPFPEPERERTRGEVGAFLDQVKTDDTSPLYFVRVQPVATGQTLRDLRAVLRPSLAGILLPKVYGPDDVVGADALLRCLEAEIGRERGSTWIYPILETAQSIRLAYEIASASSRVAYMGGAVSRFGDIHQAVGFRWTAEGSETHYLRSKVLIDARAAGVRWPISGMWGGDLDDLDGLRAWAVELRNLGYFGMMLGDPSLVPTVHEVFTPTPDEIAYWQDLDRLAREAEEAGTGPIVYGDPNQGEGHVVHIAHVGSARMNLEWARQLGLLG